MIAETIMKIANSWTKFALSAPSPPSAVWNRLQPPSSTNSAQTGVRDIIVARNPPARPPRGRVCVLGGVLLMVSGRALMASLGTWPDSDRT